VDEELSGITGNMFPLGKGIEYMLFILNLNVLSSVWGSLGSQRIFLFPVFFGETGV
jgi:hypothetical protein